MGFGVRCLEWIAFWFRFVCRFQAVLWAVYDITLFAFVFGFVYFLEVAFVLFDALIVLI